MSLTPQEVAHPAYINFLINYCDIYIGDDLSGARVASVTGNLPVRVGAGAKTYYVKRVDFDIMKADAPPNMERFNICFDSPATMKQHIYREFFVPRSVAGPGADRP